MMISYHRIPWNHPLLKEKPQHRLGRSAEQLLAKTADATGGVTAKVNGKVVGFFRYFDDGGEVIAAGTWVAPKYRRRGIAKMLWILAMKWMGQSEIQAVVVSREGHALIRSLSKKTDRIKEDRV